MDNADTVLNQFGGVLANELNNALKLDDDAQDNDRVVFSQSSYIDINNLSELNLPSTPMLNILTINIQSVSAKFSKLLGFLTILKENDISIDILNIQETWLSDPQGKICCGHGGLFTYVKDTYQAKFRPLYKKSTLYEAMFLEITSDRLKGKITVGNVYRPSTNSSDTNYAISAFIKEFQPIVEKLDKEKSSLIICGDFNINLLLTNQRETYQEFFDMLVTRGLLPQATLPTRFSTHRATLIDNIFFKPNNGNHTTKSVIVLSKLSDHFPIISGIDILKKPVFRPKYVYVHEKSPNAIRNFISEVDEKIKSTRFEHELFTDPNINYESFEKIISSSKSKHLPYKRKRFNKYQHKISPWITSEILNMIKFKDQLYIDHKCHRPDTDEYRRSKINLCNYSKLLDRNIRLAKKAYYHKQFEKFKLDSRKTWETINDILSRKKIKKEFPTYFNIKGNQTSNKQIIADEFNEFFTNIGPKLSKEIKPPSNLSYRTFLKKTITTTFTFDTVTTETVVKILSDLSPKTSCGHDEISTILLKLLAPSISVILTVMINQSLCTGIFPAKLKIAKVLPLHKKSDPHLFDNYRPISLLPTVSKVFEKIVYRQLYDYLTINKLIYDSQYGFRTLHSTELAALELSDRLSNNLEKGKIPIAIFLDLSKAFDTLDHEILLSKLSYYGVNGSALSWFSSYLTDRYQYVYLDGTESSMLSISTGVPQGSVLGPLLFLVYMNDIAEASDKFHSILFADDTTLTEPFCTFDLLTANNKYDKKKISDTINIELRNIYEWLCVNKLSLNVSKTKFMVFNYRQRKIDNIILYLKINDHIIERVNQFNFLGTIFDEHLNWSEHTNKIANKISRTLGMMNRLKHTLPLFTLKLLYNSLILPHIQYGILNWGFKYNRIFKLQKRAMRIITCSKYNAHTSPIFKSQELLKIEDIFKISLLKFLYKLEKGSLPSYFSGIFITHTADHQHNTRYRDTERLPVPRTSSAEETIRHYLPTFVEDTPDLIKDKIHTHSPEGFAHYAKQYFIKLYRTECDVPNCHTCGQQL